MSLFTISNCHILYNLIFSVVMILQQGHGFRNELAEMLADIKPRFIRFPGVCYVIYLDSLDQIVLYIVTMQRFFFFFWGGGFIFKSGDDF